LEDAENQPLIEADLPSAPDAESPSPIFSGTHLSNPRWVAGAKFFAFIILVRLVLIPLVFAAARPLARRGEAYWTDLSEALVLACVLIATWIMAKFERRSVFSYGLKDRQMFRNFATGASTGFLSLTLMLLCLFATRHLKFGWSHPSGAVLISAALVNVFGFMIVALFEETAFRGYALFALTEAIGFWPGAIAMSLFFAFAHRANPGEADTGLLAVFAFGMLLAFSLWRTGSLLWAVGFHFMWDYSESFLYGVPDSGLVSPEHLLSAKFVGPAWITGGSVGPEGSWFIFLVLAAVALVIHLTYPQRQFGKTDSLRSHRVQLT
jgi:CAAX protease family protein